MNWIVCMYLWHLWVVHTVFHDIPPMLVYNLKKTALLRHLLHDVLWTEDGLQVKPLTLYLQPLIYSVLDTDQTLLPGLMWKSKVVISVTSEYLKKMTLWPWFLSGRAWWTENPSWFEFSQSGHPAWFGSHPQMKGWTPQCLCMGNDEMTLDPRPPPCFAWPSPEQIPEWVWNDVIIKHHQYVM